ncbi:heat shock protein DnaJ domain protein [Stanieria cyanosphaera PCC 7437]|uniref:Heat shock protein DnaJ domain protein n=1 Tax=Stanieria cyanosphaera (strain ATCC 29371 / PCC 7437) TaxID=111780 RepID=K9XX13_STAC7|nr:J domain-containing protein [Stanieria cyanosphaera]AFZ36594.1 heat shock protein DnaJ domain protein [Stanieria cyanosphaera PCC 7437]
MDFAIKHGLFKFKITDYHAILGVPLDADAKQIRLRYLKIAQTIHPDIFKGNSEQKKLVNQILSKLVNPAYENLSRKTAYVEHQLVLTQVGKQIAEQNKKIHPVSQLAQELLENRGDLELTYHKFLKIVSNEQYQSLDQITDKIAQISELNLVYLMLKQAQGINKEEISPAKITQSQPQRQPQPTSPPPTNIQQPTHPQTEEITPQSRVASYLRRAQEYIDKKNFTMAVSELRDGLKIDPNNSTCHALLGQTYLSQDQLTMAKVHINKAYQLDPKDIVAIKMKQVLDKLTKNDSTNQSSAARTQGSQAESKSGNGNIFGGLFGSKKK